MPRFPSPCLSFYYPSLRCTPTRSKLCACVSFSCHCCASFLLACSIRSGTRRGEERIHFYAFGRQWHGPPHSSYLHSFNATWGPWNVQATTCAHSRTYGTAYPCPPAPTRRWHSSFSTKAAVTSRKIATALPRFRYATRSGERKKNYICLGVSVYCN